MCTFYGQYRRMYPKEFYSCEMCTSYAIRAVGCVHSTGKSREMYILCVPSEQNQTLENITLKNIKIHVIEYTPTNEYC